MTQEDKKLLLKDLSARLTYGVKAYVKNWSKLDRKYYEGVYTVDSIHPSLNTVLACSDKGSVEVILGYSDYVIKPYLFPLESMSKEQESYLHFNTKFRTDRFEDLVVKIDEDDNYFYTDISDYTSIIDWLNKNHFDYRGLIEKGLAIDATGLNIY